jgi:hypothetical protein
MADCGDMVLLPRLQQLWKLGRMPLNLSHLSDSHMMKNYLAPNCNHCDIPIIILHIMQECPLYNEGHKTFHHPGTLCDILAYHHGSICNTVAFHNGINVGNFI